MADQNKFSIGKEFLYSYNTSTPARCKIIGYDFSDWIKIEMLEQDVSVPNRKPGNIQNTNSSGMYLLPIPEKRPPKVDYLEITKAIASGG